MELYFLSCGRNKFVLFELQIEITILIYTIECGFMDFEFLGNENFTSWVTGGRKWTDCFRRKQIA